MDGPETLTVMGIITSSEQLFGAIVDKWNTLTLRMEIVQLLIYKTINIQQKIQINWHVIILYLSEHYVCQSILQNTYVTGTS